MAVVWLSGFESGLASANGGGLAISSPAASNATIVTTAGRVKSGTYSNRINNPGASTIGVRGLVTLSVSGVVNMGFWLYLETLPAADTTLCNIQGATAGNLHLDFDQGTGKFAAADDVSGQIGIWNSCPVLSADTWYWIALKLDRTNDQASLTITPDGGSPTDCGTINGSNWTGNTGWVALGSDVAQGAFDAFYDDVIICTGGTEYPLAPHEILALRPGSDGTHNVAGTEYIDGDSATTPNFTSSSTDVWTRLDDPDPWSTTRKTTGNVSCEVHSAGTYLELVNVAAASGKPDATAVRALLAYSSVTATTNNGSATVIRTSAGSDQAVFGDFTTGADYSESSNFFKGVIVTKPAGGWTKTELDAIRWRIGRASNSSDISPRPTWQGLMVEIAYPIATGTTYQKANHADADLTAAGARALLIQNAGAGVVDLVAIGANALVAVDTGAGVLAAVGSGVAQKVSGSGTTYTKQNAGVSDRVGSGARVLAIADAGAGVAPLSAAGARSVGRTKTGAGVLVASASGARALARVKTGSGVSALSSAGARALTIANAGAGVLDAVGSGAAQKVGAGGTTYQKQNAGVAVFSESAVRALVTVNAGVGALVATAAGARSFVLGKTGAGVLVASGGGSAIRGGVVAKSGAGVSDRSAAGGRALSIANAGTGALAASGGGVQTAQQGTTYQKAGFGVTVFTATGPQVLVISKAGSGIQPRTSSANRACVYSESGTGERVFVGSGSKATLRAKTGIGILSLVGSGATDRALAQSKFFGPPSPSAALVLGGIRAKIYGAPSPGKVKA